jgi:hypothetical protein
MGADHLTQLAYQLEQIAARLRLTQVSLVDAELLHHIANDVRAVAMTQSTRR